ncbi:hypothetical protein MTZ49_05800 [Entomomonas sp. E2T0]|uniref:hypothetical protein n=1 Tax=Entomomonas sp. E2T0 TaxID=2930213 RepID=UPI0022280F26|nr:hypothetical protein [Entomomonas sp. E2T0]UYZ85068.1 hypothetical protein MTZ49_05800 [Entomomonas sp. E2T0]
MKTINLFSLILLTFFLTACNTTYKTAQNYYNSADYVNAVKTITADTNNPPSEEKIDIIKNSIQHLQDRIKQYPRGRYNDRIEDYKKLWEIRNLTAKTPYKNVTNNIDPEQLAKLIAQEHHLKGLDIMPSTPAEYQQQIKIFETGIRLDFGNIDLREDLAKSKKTYATMMAESSYNKGKKALSEKDYEEACEHFKKTIKHFERYGRYKDEDKLFAKYDPIWRKEKATQNYSKASQLVKTAKTYQDYKEIAGLYHAASDIYSRYGSYKDSKVLANKYNQLWTTQHANELFDKAKKLADNATTRSDHRKAAEAFTALSREYSNYNNSLALAQKEASLGYIYVYYKSNDSGKNYWLNNLIDNEVNAILRSKDFKQADNNHGDFFISVTYTEHANDHQKILSVEDHIDTNFKYKEIKELIQRNYVLKTSIRVGGKMNYSYDFSIPIQSSITRTFYQGNYPSWKREKYEKSNANWDNSLKSPKDLANDAEAELKVILKKHLDNIKWQAINTL